MLHEAYYYHFKDLIDKRISFFLSSTFKNTGKMATTSPAENPGNIMASAVDAEVTKFKVLQQEITKFRTDLQFVLGQRTENEMVQQELDLIGNDGIVYKRVGPVLLQQEVDEARQTVQKRLEFIQSEIDKMESKIAAKEKEGTEIAVKVQQMQSQLQQVTAEAVRAIAEQHGK
jgi:prefoldin beta subunit